MRVVFFLLFSNMPQLDLYIFSSQFLFIFLFFLFYFVFLKYILPILTFEYKIKRLIQFSFKRKVIVDYLNNTNLFYSFSKNVMVMYQVLRGFKTFIKNLKAPRIVVPLSIIRYGLLLSYYKEKSSFILKKTTYNSFSNNE
jgi:hypothetical protein